MKIIIRLFIYVFLISFLKQMKWFITKITNKFDKINPGIRNGFHKKGQKLNMLTSQAHRALLTENQSDSELPERQNSKGSIRIIIIRNEEAYKQIPF